MTRQDLIAALWHGRNPFADPPETLRRLHLAGTLDQPNEGERAGAIDRHEEVQLALFGADLCDIDVEVADRVLFNRLLQNSRVCVVGEDFRRLGGLF